ncbi:hypothetical protein CLOBOL_02984 [Enterocloster bolteae ATCC BAA-613]|uniref:Uncharacterized protein n=1 Tax=Enterocloster bolteae (strain ATCC BAA-613 / DSM 15670 / CCUG 46953 / JCM 12243 / WAL 16351) TaxID=411902 RepID=A8RRD5_ENTBW|nr:hypothetical protein CLOBOL_02984 [Enterocloster bolteae ATCC BAA-613]
MSREDFHEILTERTKQDFCDMIFLSLKRGVETCLIS